MNIALETRSASAPLSGIVEQLAALRRQAQRRRYAGATPQLPSRHNILALAEDFISVLYPRHLGEIANSEIDAFVAEKLTRAQRALEREMGLEYLLAGRGETSGSPASPAEAAAEFVAGLPGVRAQVDADIRAALEADPSQGSFDELVFCSPGVAAILRHRVAHELYRLHAPLMAKIIAEDSRSKTGVEIHPGAEVGEGFSIASGAGLLIGETAIIGRNVRVHSSVVIGEGFAIDIADEEAPQGVIAFSTAPTECGHALRRRRHPKIEDDVVIFAGASLYGPITIGHGAIIGRNVFLTSDVPPMIRVE